MQSEAHTDLFAGSIVSNQGFIEQFGTIVSSTGAVSLDAGYVAAWGGTVSRYTKPLADPA